MLIRSLINYITCATHLEFVICMLHYVSYGSLEYPEKGSFILFIKEILELSFIKLTFSRIEIVSIISTEKQYLLIELNRSGNKGNWFILWLNKNSSTPGRNLFQMLDLHFVPCLSSDWNKNHVVSQSPPLLIYSVELITRSPSEYSILLLSDTENYLFIVCFLLRSIHVFICIILW